MHVEHFMTKNPVAVDVTTTVTDAAKQMRDKGVGCVVVLRDGKVAGLVDDRQLATRALAEGMEGDTPVEQIMMDSPATLTLEDNIFSVIDTMRSANVARRVPVVNANNELLGIVSISDVAIIAKDLLDGVMLEETHHAMEEARILTGAKRLVQHIRRPTKEGRLPPEQEIVATTEPTPMGLPPESGGAGQAMERKTNP